MVQSTLAPSILIQMIGCVHSWELCEKLHGHFDVHMQAHANQLHNTSPEGKTMSEFLVRLKALAIFLSSIGDPVTRHEHLDALHGLPCD